jgi:hypothetical protein
MFLSMPQGTWSIGAKRWRRQPTAPVLPRHELTEANEPKRKPNKIDCLNGAPRSDYRSIRSV